MPQLPPPTTKEHNTHQMITISKSGVSNPKTFLAKTVNNIDLTKETPTIVQQALQCPYWKESMDNEIKALYKYNTWTLIDPPLNATIVGCKWVFAVKKNQHGEILRYKDRLVAKGFHQIEGIDYEEAYSSVVRPITIRIIITIALTQGWVTRQFDFDNAFLNGKLEDKVFMQQLPGYTTQNSTRVFKLHKALYGLKQAPRAWDEPVKTNANINGVFIKIAQE
ncbi:uncharacterized mitochondrial protein AtMg00820-like [Arachis stenosperma]|uniref:uncharacterized mitochondrial protein AtMg00820-like n=1 Tax=Arachis stenosperma TaxID=217475 RepID=UPI0025AC2564|nr:uncharacterized mitochondrial protein AtMg00820-like [Arachis stenosperma]